MKIAPQHKLSSKLKLKVLALLSGGADQVADILKLFLYRSEVFGRPFTTWVQATLRGASFWTVGERELFASVVSRANACQFCESSHRAFAAHALGSEAAMKDAMDGAKDGVRKEARAAMVFIEKLTKTPMLVNASDVNACIDAGISRTALEEVVHVCAIFCTINRIADAMAFELQSAQALATTAKVIVERGYASPLSR